MENHYEVLGVRRGASKKEIKKKFYQLAKKYHPDVNDEPGAEARFKRINEAYAVLTSDRDRHEYDYNVNSATSSTARPKYNYDGSPFYNFDVWYTMHYGTFAFTFFYYVFLNKTHTNSGADVAERMRLMGMNREKATSRQMHISSPSSSSSESTNRGWGDFDRAMKKLEGQKRKFHTVAVNRHSTPTLCRVLLKYSRALLLR